MKKIFLAAAILLFATTVTFAHDGEGRKERKEIRTDRHEIKQVKKKFRKARREKRDAEVNDFIRVQFTQDFPDAKYPVYSKTKGFYEVSFVSGKKMKIANYNFDDQLIGTTTKESYADLPENAQKSIQKRYPGYEVVSVIKFDDNESNEDYMILYDTSFDSTDSYFVEIQKDGSNKVLQVGLSGDVSLFKDLK